MQAPQKEDYISTDFDRLYTEQVFDVDPAIGLAQDSGQEPEAFAPGRRIRHLIVPVSTSILIHLCLLLLFRQLVPVPNPISPDAQQLPASIQISFRPRPSPPPAPGPDLEPEPAPEPAPEIAEQEELPVQPPAETIVADQPSVPESPVNQARQLADEPTQITEPQSQAPRLAAPALLDLRDLIQERARDHETRRIYSNVNCDERQRRTDLIDCGDEDPNAQYDYAAAEQNATVEFFATLTAPGEDTSNQPADRTTGDARTRASLEHMNGNLGANPLIRGVMGQP
ncbi:MAG: hypothetical protein Q7L19_07510 [Pseudohongiella sp.]|nr:hypothetical protein [Pseudohongiella sp.]